MRKFRWAQYLFFFSWGPACLAQDAPDLADRMNQGILLALGILAGALVLNFLVQAGSRKLKQRFGARPLVKVALHLGTPPLQILILLVGLYYTIRTIPPWQPVLDWFMGQSMILTEEVQQVFATPILTMGSTRLSLSSLLVTGALGVGLLLMGRYFRDWLKEQVLAPLGLDTGNRETIASVATYLGVSLGFVVLLQASGINLSSLTVLAGVLGIGIGFGLQNLASNFISGVAILVEQPIKVGDFVEVNDLLGTVQRISVRSTVIETQDGVSIIVPNSKFIENNVINWSYTQPASRLHVPVNVAYTSDPSVVTEALLTAARRETRILRDPPPQVWLKGFGNDALEFDLLVWIPIPQDREPIKSALNYFIEEEFRRKTIEIPVSQLDISLRSLGKLEQLLFPTLIDTKAAIARGSELPPSLRDLLRRVSFFKDCSDTDLRTLVEQGYRSSYAQGEVICRQGDPGTSFYLILEGAIGVMAEPSGHLLAELPTGAFCGEIALLTGTKRTATLTALTATTLFIVDRHALQMLLNQHKTLAEEISVSLAQRTQELKDLGLLPEDPDLAERNTPVNLIRERIRQIFGI